MLKSMQYFSEEERSTYYKSISKERDDLLLMVRYEQNCSKCLIGIKKSVKVLGKLAQIVIARRQDSSKEKCSSFIKSMNNHFKEYLRLRKETQSKLEDTKRMEKIRNRLQIKNI
jgi:hypothetical protein